MAVSYAGAATKGNDQYNGQCNNNHIYGPNPWMSVTVANDSTNNTFL